MRSILPILRYVSIAIALASTSAKAIDSLVWRPLPAGGLSVSLVTSGYQFQAPNVGEPDIQGRILPPAPGEKTSFVASVSLSNRGRTPIQISFNDAGPRWTFRVINSQDEEIWRSDSDIASPQVITPDVLGPGKTWKRSVRIPLIVADAPLPPGVYSLQATLNANKTVSATSVFEVVTGYASDTGIKGLVLKEVRDLATDAITEVPATGAYVTISEIATPTGPRSRSRVTVNTKTDSDGRFKVSVPAGFYRVSAYDPTYGFPTTPGEFYVFVPAYPTATANVTVQQGLYTDVTLHLKGAGLGAVITQGIRGTIGRSYVDSPKGVDGGGETVAILPSSGFTVRVEQLDAPGGATPFQWNGFANAFGRFQVATPPGQFRVTAVDIFRSVITASIPPSIYAPTATTVVSVTPQTVTDVNLIITNMGQLPDAVGTSSTE